MKKYALLLLFISSMATATSPSELLVTQLQKFERLSANFKQSVMAGKKSPQQVSGKMALERPGKFHWETKEPTQQILIADGRHVWVYDVDLEQVTRQPQSTTDQNSPAIFLTGNLQQIKQRFDVSEPKSDHFSLKAKSTDDMFQTIELIFNKQKLQKMAVQTKLGQRSEFNFSDVKYNPTLSQQTFSFKPPKGVDVIYND